MTGPSPRAPATARALSAALNELGIHTARARPADVLPLLGMLLAKTETDTAARAPVGQNPPVRLTRLLVGYHQQTPPPTSVSSSTGSPGPPWKPDLKNPQAPSPKPPPTPAWPRLISSPPTTTSPTAAGRRP
ncbi:hypothetical protein ACU4GG_43260 [Streptomyces nojiriensis]